jgi:ubiquinone/menaquinone biosynthesis C-methylase UbiE
VCRSFVPFRARAEIIDWYLRNASLAQAIFRAAELGPIAGSWAARPVLDLGCGSGQFATAAAVEPLDVGVDVSPRQIRRARRSGMYRHVVCADARCLPFRDHAFSSVVSISVFEHITEPDQVVREAYRVLAPGGQLRATIVLSKLHEELAWSRLLRAAHAPKWAAAYGWLSDRCLRHRCMLSADEWLSLVRNAGFAVIKVQLVVNPAACRWFDRLLPLAVPHWLVEQILGQRIRWPRAFVRLLQPVVTPLSEGAGEEGVVLYLAAERPGGEASVFEEEIQ